MSTHYPEGERLQTLIKKRRRRGMIFRYLFLAATITAILVLLTLALTIINNAFGLAAVKNTVEPATLIEWLEKDPATTSIPDLSKTELALLLMNGEFGLTSGQGRQLERERRFFPETLIFEPQEKWDVLCASESPAQGCGRTSVRSSAEMRNLIYAEIIEPEVFGTWSLYQSIFNRSEIEAVVAEQYPDTTLGFRSWVTPQFLSNPQSSDVEKAGIRTAILGSLWVIAITTAFSFPVGVGTAIYLEEYATGDNWFERIIQTNINNLAGVPSIIYGILGLAIFVRIMEPITSGRLFGLVQDATTANGRTIISAGLTLGLLILPIIIIASQEAIKAVPSSLRQASYGLGATRWQTIWHNVLPNALPGILTGTILAMSRAIGETAPLVVVGASTFITADPTSPFSKFTVLPIQIYQWTARPQPEFRNIAAAAIIVLLILLLTMNASAVLLRNRYSTKYS